MELASITFPRVFSAVGFQGSRLPGGKSVNHAGAEGEDGDGCDLVIETDQTPEYFSKVTEKIKAFKNQNYKDDLT